MDKSGSLSVENDGPRIVASNYWATEHAAAGAFLVSSNAGTFRLLIPKSKEAAINDMRAAKGIAVTRGPCPEMGLADAFEVLFDDQTDDPLALVLTPEAFQAVPVAENARSRWFFAGWTLRKGHPHCEFTKPCRYRIACKIPDPRPWDRD